MKKLFYALGCAAAVCLAGGCDDDDDLGYQTVSVSFAVSEVGMEGSSAEVGLKLSRAAKEDLKVTVAMTSTEVSVSDLVFTPALEDGKLVVSIPTGATTASFQVAKAAGETPEGSMQFLIEAISSTGDYKIGTVNETKLSFSPIVSTGSEMQLEGKAGGSEGDADLKYRNIVYVDLSNNRQVQVYRKTWDLGFYCGDEFRVILNSAYKTLAAGSGKTDFAAVTLEDADAAPSLLGSMMGDSFEKNADDTSGDLAKTVFGEIAADGEVFFVASEDNKTTDGVEDRTLWYKVKVSRGEAGYKVEYGKVGDTSPKVAEIAKDPLYGFIGFSLASGEQVEAQPEAKKWDLSWSYAAAWSTMNSGPMLSFSQDVITINRHSGVAVATVMLGEGETLAQKYQSYTLADAQAAEFEVDADIIGTTWRDPFGKKVKTDRFFVIRDCGGNYYKLQFLSFIEDEGGERGRPEIGYVLLK